jgi:Calcium-activated chloride channel
MSMLAFYHSLPQGFYFGFLAVYTNFLMILMVVTSAFYVYSIFEPVQYLTYLPFLPIFIGIWSSVFLMMWRRREKELAYCFDCFEEEFDKPQRDEFYGKVKLEDVTNKVIKADNG